MHYLTFCVAGLFVFDQNKKLIEYKLFEKDAKKIAEKLAKLENNESFPELEELKRKYSLETSEEVSSFFKDNMRSFVGETGFIKNEEELNRIINEVSIEYTKNKISNISKKDKMIIQAVSALDDTIKTLNQMSERLREWHSLNSPKSSIADHEKFAEHIIELDLSKLVSSKLKEKDVLIIKKFSEQLKKTFELKKELESYLEKSVPEEIPNISALLGPILAARLLAKAGSLERLAKLPSSAIQLLGAEKSLFKYLKGKETMRGPPKFGVLFVHPDIQTAQKEVQGKIARLLSAKLTLAARADFYSKHDISKELLEDYRKKLSEIR